MSRTNLLPGSNRFKSSDIPQEEADSLVALYYLTNGNAWTNKTNWLTDPVVNNWYGVTVAGGHVTQTNLNANNLVGSVASWVMPTTLTTLYLYMNAGLSGDISGWVLPASLVNFAVSTTSVSGDISAWVLPASLVNFYVYTTSVSGSPILTSAVSLRQFQLQNCALPQATVDAIALAVYNRRAAFTDATPNLNIGGTNSAPSGIYQDGDPPTTGKEYIYELVVDPEIEGFKKWTVTYTA